MRSQLAGCWRAVLFGCLLLPAIASAQAKRNPNPIEKPEVRSLDLRGVESVDPVDLENSIASAPTTCRNTLYVFLCPLIRGSDKLWRRQYLDRDEIARDMLRIRVYYWKRGYRSADVDTVITKTGENQVSVVFNITEHEPTRVGRIQIDYDSLVLREKRVRKLTLLKAGDPLDLVKLDSMRLSFVNEMWSEGHSDATVDTVVTVDEARRVADIHFTLIPNHTTYVGDIVINGLEKVSRQTVLNSISLRNGELFRASQVLESQRNLFESNLFRLAAVEVPPQFDSVKQVTITVVESPLHQSHAGVGVTNIDFFQTDGQYTAYNLLGGARRLDVTGHVGNILGQQLAGKGFFYAPDSALVGDNVSSYLQPTWAASIDFKQPAFLHRPRNQAGFSAFAHRRSNAGIFIDRGYGGSVTITNQVRIRAPVSLTYHYELNRVDASDVYFCVNYGVCEFETINVLRSRQALSPVSLVGLIDRSDDPLDPTRGYQARAELEYASNWTASDFGYGRAYLDLAAYNHHGFVNTYGGHFRMGFIRTAGGHDDVFHPRKLFYAGGATSVRGYATNQLGPRVLTIAPERLNFIGCSDLTYTTTCDPNGVVNDSIGGLKDSDFRPQPLGGTSIVEASIEYRKPIGFRRKLWGAVFLDGAIVGSGSIQGFSELRNLVDGAWALTPGAGIRYQSPVGPIRVDVGFNPAREELLNVITETVENGQRRVVTLANPRVYSPTKTLLDRFTLHFSIGQAW